MCAAASGPGTLDNMKEEEHTQILFKQRQVESKPKVLAYAFIRGQARIKSGN